MGKQIVEKGKTLWESKEFHKNVIVCSIGRELKPSSAGLKPESLTDEDYIIHDYIKSGDLNTAPFPMYFFGLKYGI